MDTRRKILLVDESKTFQRLFANSLSEETCELLLRSSGEDALALIGEREIDFICSSFYLPDMEGIEFCRRVRRMREFSAKPFVLLTSVDDQAALARALPAGVTEIFHKNDVEQLLAFIQRFPSPHALLCGRVLYVEDNASQRGALQALLEHRGLSVDAYSLASEALEQFLIEDYDIVLTDIVLDGTMSGLTFVNRIRRQVGAKGEVPVLAVTAFDDQSRRIELFNLGVTDYILKPVVEEELFVRIGSLLEMRRLTREIERQRQQRHADELASSDGKLQLIFDASPDALLICDKAGTISMANRRVEALLGYPVAELLGQNVDLLVPQHVRDGHAALRARFASVPGARLMGEGRSNVRARRKDGSECDVEVSLSRIETPQGMFFAGALRDITQKRRAEEELRIAAAAFESDECMMVTDAGGTILRVNQAFCRSTGYSPTEIVGKNPRILKSGRHDAAFYRNMWDTIARSGSWQGEIWDRHKNGEIHPKLVTISAVKDDTGRVTHYVGMHVDISVRKESEARIQQLAYYDQLTELPNRALLLDRLRQAQSANARSGLYGALLLVDLDDFRMLNDSYGHESGDYVLTQIAARLATCLRQGDTLARLGGDEFIVLLSELGSDKHESAGAAETVAQNIFNSLASPFTIAKTNHHCAACIGITLFQGTTLSREDLLKQAELAMYRAKGDDSNSVRFFDPAMEAAVMAHARLEEGLRMALPENQLELHYQAQVESGNRIIGAEVLLRWRHPQHGMVSPGEFIPIAEKSGAILSIGRWVLESACAQLASWAQKPGFEGLTLAVNVSARQFRQQNFVDSVISIMDATGAQPTKLKLELTESLLVENLQGVAEKMFALKARGVGFSLDDFGTGYSSLAYLKRLPLDQLKIDQSFVRDILTDGNDAAISRTVVALAKNLGLSVIAEGVESESQRQFLSDAGCHAYQGYLFSRPVIVSEFERLVLDD